MQTVISDFNKRCKEIHLYLNHIEKIIEQDAKLYIASRPKRKFESVNIELQKVLKANIFLLLYNLSESSIKQALSQIYDSITDENLTYDDVIDEIRKIWIQLNYKNFNQKGTEFIFAAMEDIVTDVINIEFDAEKRISGNIDGLKIRKFASELGFSIRSHHSLKNGEKLHLVKTQRNKLAHGDLSFAECGRNYTVPQLKEIHNQVIKYLNRILLNIEKYIIHKKFEV